MGLPSKPHETSYLAAKGHTQYAYYASALTQVTKERTGKMEYMAEASEDNGNDFDTLIENLGNTMNCICTNNKAKQIIAKPNKELTDNDQVKGKT